MTNELIPMTSVAEAYADETAIDQTIPIRARFERIRGIVVTDDPATIEAATGARTKINALGKEAAAPRMRVQRAIKSHLIGRFAFTKSALEKEIEAESARLKINIEAHSRSAEVLALATEPKDWVLIVKSVDLATMNRLVGELTDRGILAENRGPFVEEEAK